MRNAWERKKGVRYRGIYKAADGRYRSAGTWKAESASDLISAAVPLRVANVIVTGDPSATVRLWPLTGSPSLPVPCAHTLTLGPLIMLTFRGTAPLPPR